MTEKLEDTMLAKKIKAYNEKWNKDQELREKEIAERKEQSIFEEDSENEHNPLAQLTKGEVHPTIAKDPDFPSLTVAQRQRIEAYLREGLSIRSVKKALHVDNIDLSYGSIQAIRKKMKEKEVAQSSSK
jgi:hypothetical protein